MSGGELAAASAVMGLGAAVQGSVGFGLNLIAAPALVLIDRRLVPGPALFAALVLTALVAARERRSVDLRGVGWAFAGRVPGTAAGAVAVALLRPHQLAAGVGVAVLGGVVMTARGPRLRPTRRALVGAGFASGLMGTVSAVGGPPMALVLQHQPGPRLRGTLSVFFTAGAALSLAFLAAAGRFGPRELAAGMVLVPGLVAGFVVSGWTARVVDRGRTRAAVLGLSALSAVGVLVRAAWG